MYREVFATRLREIRTKMKLTQREIEDITGISHSDISKYERNELEPTLEKLGILSAYFKTPIDWFLGYPSQQPEIFNTLNNIEKDIKSISSELEKEAKKTQKII